MKFQTPVSVTVTVTGGDFYPIVDLFPASRENTAFTVKKISRQAVLFPYFK